MSVLGGFASPTLLETHLRVAVCSSAQSRFVSPSLSAPSLQMASFGVPAEHVQPALPLPQVVRALHAVVLLAGEQSMQVLSGLDAPS